MTCPTGSPGSHPHADRPNWRPAETADDYLRNCQDGLEEHSERRLAKLLRVSRMDLYRWRMMAEIPKDLFERLLRCPGKPTTKALAQIGAAVSGNTPAADIERCPCCGHVLRTRWLRPDLVVIVNEWIEERRPQDGA